MEGVFPVGLVPVELLDAVGGAALALGREGKGALARRCACVCVCEAVSAGAGVEV